MKSLWRFLTSVQLAIVLGGAILVAAVAGFYAVVFTFFGVGYLLPGLHSYRD